MLRDSKPDFTKWVVVERICSAPQDVWSERRPLSRTFFGANVRLKSAESHAMAAALNLLAQYGSDDEPREEAPSAGVFSAAPAAAAPPAAAAAAPLLAALPKPAARAPLFAGLPRPGAKRAKQAPGVFFRAVDYGDLPEGLLSDDDDDLGAAAAPAKRARGADDQPVLAESLPAPQRPLGGRRVEVEGAIAPAAEAAAPAAAASAAATAGNEAYRVGGGGGLVRGEHEGRSFLYDPVSGQYYWPEAPAGGAGGAAARPAGPARLPADPVAALEAALAAEAGPGGVQFREVSGAALRYMPPAARAEADAARAALGPEYEARLRADAGRAAGGIGKLAKSRHQLSSLLAHAKEQELRDLDRKAGASKTKAETQRKYGW